MGTRGRKSAAELSIVSDSTEIVPRPKAPGELTPEQSQEWQSITERMPADWFPRETHALLAQYCRHVVAARRVACLIQKAEQADEFDISEYEQLLRMQDREGKSIGMLCTKMRLTQQATVRSEKARKPTMVSRPWVD